MFCHRPNKFLLVFIWLFSKAVFSYLKDSKSGQSFVCSCKDSFCMSLTTYACMSSLMRSTVLMCPSLCAPSSLGDDLGGKNLMEG